MQGEKRWYRSYAQNVPHSINYEKITFPDVLARSADRFRGKDAFIYMGKRITFDELHRLVNRFTRALRKLGVARGDKISTLLPNIPQHLIANHAVYNCGAVTVMNNPLYTERELEYQLNDSDSTVLITLDLLLPRALSLRDKTGIKHIITCHINDFLPFPKKQLYPYVKKTMYRKITPQQGVYQFMDLLKEQSDDPVKNEAEWEKPAAIIYTGGTTGVSKGVVLSHANICSVVQLFRAWFPDLEDGGECLIGNYPIFHSAGYSVSQNLPVWSGWTSIMIPRPEPGIIIDSLKKYKPGFLPGVPTIFVGLLNNGEFMKMDLSYIKGFFAGAAPLPLDVVKTLKDLTGADIYDVFGQTENTAFATCTPWGGKVKTGTVGIPLPDTEIRIVDLDTGDKELPAGESGEICIRGPQVMMEYYKKPEETAATLRNGWLYTADIGFMDEEGYLVVNDRKKDMIIAAGFNIYPTEIDNILTSHPRILEACCIGVPDGYRGETIKAYVVKKDPALNEDEVIDYCKKNLAAYKVPRGIVFINELPKSTVGKILRRAVKEIDMGQRKTAG